MDGGPRDSIRPQTEGHERVHVQPCKNQKHPNQQQSQVQLDETPNSAPKGRAQNNVERRAAGRTSHSST